MSLHGLTELKFIHPAIVNVMSDSFTQVEKKIVSTGTEHLTWSSVDPESYQEEGMCMQCMQLPFWKNGHTIPGFDID